MTKTNDERRKQIHEIILTAAKQQWPQIDPITTSVVGINNLNADSIIGMSAEGDWLAFPIQELIVTLRKFDDTQYPLRAAYVESSDILFVEDLKDNYPTMYFMLFNETEQRGFMTDKAYIRQQQIHAIIKAAAQRHWSQIDPVTTKVQDWHITEEGDESIHYTKEFMVLLQGVIPDGTMYPLRGMYIESSDTLLVEELNSHYPVLLFTIFDETE
jgi:hypothetical protein